MPHLPRTERIRNFSIIAHIDHGKSTLADRLLEITGAISERDMRDQVLDTMDLERERGITIKAQTVRIPYTSPDGREYILNLIDTPGHVDFSYEVSKSLDACEGALLLVDAAQGIEAQTLANSYLAVGAGLEIVPVLNKIDLPAADPETAAAEISGLLGIDTSQILLASAKTGEGVPEILEAIVERIPSPSGEANVALRALIFDSYYDQYRGVISSIRVVEGELRSGIRVKMMATGASHEAEEIGVLTPAMTPVKSIGPGEVGYLIAGIKDVSQAKVGDTVTLAENPASAPLPGYQEPKPMVFCGLYPIDGGDYPELRVSLEKLSLNDASFTYEPETSKALGFGFRCGFLGLLHMEIVKERLEREYGMALVTTAPTVEYRAVMRNGDTRVVRTPTDLPSSGELDAVEEPMVRATILTPSEYLGPVMELCQARRGEQERLEYLSQARVEIVYRLPLAEIVVDFFDALKSRTRGYASLDYEPAGHEAANLVRVDVLLAGDPVDAFSSIVHREKAYAYGKAMVSKLRELIPRQLFDIAIQAAIGGRVIARETVKAKRKDVLAKCYGGDVSRKRKLLERQKEGRKRMKQIGSVEVPQDAFISALRIDS
ncbi:MAG: elongation factor 4 [Acidobacteria bacterium]|nr:MAG: elongation factor 4 [Acidobacteriota bacterium]